MARAAEPADGPNPEFAEVVERARAATGASAAALALESDGLVICCARAGQCAPELGAQLNRDSGVSGLCLRTGEPVLCSDAADDERVDSEAARLLGVASILAVPVHQDGTTVGLLEVFSESPRVFGDAAETALREIAEQVTASAPAENPDAHDDSVPSFEAAELSAAAAVDAEPAARDAVVAESGTDPGDAGVAIPDAFAPSSSKRRILIVLAVLALLAGAVIGLSLAMRRAKSHPTPAPVEIQPQSKAPSPAELLMRAAERGDVSAELGLAGRYREGVGVERNPSEAVRWLQQAARQGDAQAQYELGNAYADGIGVARDPINAYACYVLAGANGNPASEQALKFLTPKLTDKQIGQVRSTIGEMYLQGRGTPVDFVAAYTWFRLAEAVGNTDSQRDRTEVASKMTKADIAAAERRASEWLKRHAQQPH